MLLITISCAWITGTVLGPFWGRPGGLTFALLSLAPLLVWRRWKRPALLVIICLLTLSAATFFELVRPQNDSPLQALNDQGVIELRGTVSSAPEASNTTVALEIAVNEMRRGVDWQPARGKVMVFLAQRPGYRYGDRVWLKGPLETPPKLGGFDYQAYLGQKGISSTMSYPQARLTARGEGLSPARWVNSMRKQLSSSLLRSLPEPQASLATGILLGVRNTIPSSIKDNLSVTGTAHLLAISGMNLTIVAGLLVAVGIALFGRRHYIYVWLALSAIWLYALLTGMEAPVIRSAIMGSLFLAAELTGRQKSALVALSFSAAIMIGIHPQILTSASFQLSFLSMAGLVLISPYLIKAVDWAIQRKIGREGLLARFAFLAGSSLAVTLSATIAVWPLVAYYFGVVSFVGPLATLIIAPALPIIIVAAMITALAGLASAPLGIFCGWISWLPLSYMLWMVDRLAALPGIAASTRPVPAALVWTYYIVLAAMAGCLANQKKVVPAAREMLDRLKNVSLNASRKLAARPGILIFIPLGIAASLTALAASSLPDDDLHVSFLSVESGQAVVIQAGHQTVLIDGGENPQTLCEELGRSLPFWQRDIDLMLLTDPHLEHVNGLIEVLKRYRVKQAIAPMTGYSSAAYGEWRRLIREKEVDLTLARTGQSIRLQSGSTIDVLFAPFWFSAANKEEESSVILKLTRGQVSFLLVSDASPETQKGLAAQNAALDCTILAVPHRGEAGSLTTDLLASAQPQAAVITSKNGVPDPDALQALTDALGPERTYRTGKAGTVEFVTDGQTLRVKTAR